MAEGKAAGTGADHSRGPSLDTGELPGRPQDGADRLDRHRFHVVEPLRYGNDGAVGTGHDLGQRGLRAERADNVLRRLEPRAGAFHDLADHFVYRGTTEVTTARLAMGAVQPGHVATTQPGHQQAQADLAVLQLARVRGDLYSLHKSRRHYPV